MLPNDEIVKVALTLSKIVQTNVGIDSVDSTLFNVVNSSVEVHNLASTSRPNINLTTTLRNVEMYVGFK